MVRLRHSKLSLMGVLSLLFVAWMTASNHCALAAAPTWNHAAVEHKCCHKDGPAAPSHEQPNECCQALGATLPLVATAPAADLSSFSLVWEISFLSADFSAETRPVWSPLAAATGPPGGNLWTDVLLKRAAPAHAPPVV